VANQQTDDRPRPEVTSLVYVTCISPSDPKPKPKPKPQGHLTHTSSAHQHQPLVLSLLSSSFFFLSLSPILVSVHLFWRVLFFYSRSKCVPRVFLFLYSLSQPLSSSSVALYHPRFVPPTPITPLVTSGLDKRLTPSRLSLGRIMMIQKSLQSPSGIPCTTTPHSHYFHQMLPSA
jgi:hypothetical protein